MAPQNALPNRLDVSNRISIVNALMAQDRQEVRNHQDALLKLSYLMVTAFVGVSVFFDAQREHRTVLLIGHLALVSLYVFVYLLTFKNWLRDGRACLGIREAFFDNDCQLLHRKPFNPLRPIAPHDYKKGVH
jgi:hypothetical protein